MSAQRRPYLRRGFEVGDIDLNLANDRRVELEIHALAVRVEAHHHEAVSHEPKFAALVLVGTACDL